MKKKWTRPMGEIQVFTPQEYVAACGAVAGSGVTDYYTIPENALYFGDGNIYSDNGDGIFEPGTGDLIVHGMHTSLPGGIAHDGTLVFCSEAGEQKGWYWDGDTDESGKPTSGHYFQVWYVLAYQYWAAEEGNWHKNEWAWLCSGTTAPTHVTANAS